VLHVLPCDIARGAQVYARDVRALLSNNGDEHHILTLFRAPPAVLQADHQLDVPMGRLRRLGFDPRVVLGLRRALRQFPPDVVVAHGGEPLKYLAWMSRARWALVYLAIGTATGPARRGPRRLLYRYLLARADLVVGVSTETVEEVEDVFGVGSDRTMLVPNGRDEKTYRPRDGPASDGDGVVALFVGHLTASKRPLHFVAALNEVHRRGRHVTGLMAGDGPLENEVRQMVSSLPARVDVLGRRDDIPALLRAADVFVFTSAPEGEGMPGVLIEAQMAGLPTVATAVPGAASVVEHGITGFVVPPDDVSELVAALERMVIDGELRRSMGVAARRRALASFSLEQSVRQWEELLDRAACRRRGARGRR
jgi:glycosyltransferase involved in cell wall biosynthesis